MKKVKSLIVALCLMLGALFGLTACGGEKLPTTDYEKVAFAFKGVESSIRKAINSNSGNKNRQQSTNTAMGTKLSMNRLQGGLDTPTDVLDAISRVYVAGDSQGDIIDDLEFNQPPMMQFQCIKSVLQDVGKSYVFGTKYYNTITGNMYFDSTTGLKVSESDPNANDYKYAYTFVFAISINIDSDDIILANISFDITLTKGMESYNTYWYVEMHLDYDMTNTTPNYELLMLTANDEKDLPYYDRYVYEHDYVKVSNDKITEWRKFVLDTSDEVRKDNANDSFESYMNEGVTYSADTCQWYKNNDLRKVTRLTNEKEESIAKSFYLLGLNSSDIDGSEFKAKTGEQVEVIKTLYTTICNNFRGDVIYELICRDEDDIAHNNNNGNEDNNDNGGEQTQQISAIRFRNSTGMSFWEDQTIKGTANNNNPTIAILLSDYAHGGSDNAWACIEGDYPTVWYFDAHGGDIRRVTSNELQDFDFTLGMANNICKIDINDSIIDKIIGFGEGIATSTNKITITFLDAENHVSGEWHCEIDGDMMNLISARFRGQFPDDLGIPQYVTTNGSFNVDDKYLYVSGTDGNERDAYVRALDSADYVNIGGNVYVKIIDDGATAQKVFVSHVDNGTVTISVEEEPNTYSATWNTTLINTWTESKLPETFSVPDSPLFKYGSNEDKYVIAYCVDWNAYSEALENAGLAYRISDYAYYYYFKYSETYYCIEITCDSSIGSVSIQLNLDRLPVSFYEYGMKYKINDDTNYSDFVIGISSQVPGGITYIASGIELKAYDTITFASDDDYLNILLETHGEAFIEDDENHTMFQAKNPGKYTFIVTIYNDHGGECHITIDRQSNS